MKRFASLAAWLLLASLGDAADPPSGTAPARVRVECHMVTLPQKELLALMPDLQDAAKMEGAWRQVQTMIDQGSAKLIAVLAGPARLGERIELQSAEELRYATEYEPPQLPEDYPPEKAAEVLKTWPVVGIVPTAFETRNVGAVLELEVEEAPGGLLRTNLVAQNVRFLRWAKFDAGRKSDGDHLFIEQPIFHTMKTQCGLWTHNGERVLVGVHRVPEAATTSFEIWVLRITTVSTRK